MKQRQTAVVHDVSNITLDGERIVQLVAGKLDCLCFGVSDVRGEVRVTHEISKFY